ncbi:MAG: glycosyltransferase family 4 protein [Chloroflexi bacterium]|nr:glycosyltransferase family 4 protein [Chloroflexota bacterium]
MNIHLIRTLYPHWGAHTGFNSFRKHIDSEQYQIQEYLTPDGDGDFFIRNRAAREMLRPWVQRNKMPFYKLADLTAEMRALQQCWAGNVDIVHYLDGEHSAQYLPLLFRRDKKSRPKIVANFHQPAALLPSLVDQRVISKLDAVVLISPAQVAFFEPLLSPEKITVALSGIETDYFKPSNKPKSASPFKCITVGHWLRDFETVRQVARQVESCREIEFHVIVSGRSGPQQTGLENNPNIILQREHIDDNALLKCYQAADLLFLPLTDATANNALLEAMACGLPILATHLPSIQTYAPEQDAILIQGNDPERFAEAILYLTQQPEMRSRMGQASRARAEELNWRNIAPLYQSVYAKLANAKGTS